MSVNYKNEHLNYNRAGRIELLEIGLVDGDEQWNHMGVSSPYHRLYYIHEGETIIRDSKVGNQHKRHILKAGEFCLIRSNTLMDYYAKGPFKKSYVHFRYPMYGGADCFDQVASVIKLSVKDDVIERFVEMTRTPSLDAYFEGQASINRVLAELVKTMPVYQLPELYEDHPYLPLLTRIEQFADAKMTVDSMAKYCDQSVSDFSRKFKVLTGMSPKAYLHNLLLDRAKVLLSTTNKSVKQISGELGYTDSLYFSRFFKKYSGASPMQYRKTQIRPF